MIRPMFGKECLYIQAEVKVYLHSAIGFESLEKCYVNICCNYYKLQILTNDCIE